jgi:cell division protein FtsL
MKDSSKNAIIIVAILVIAVLSILLVQAQKTIEGQRVAIANQETQINELKAENAKLSEFSPDKILNDTKDLIKQEGADFLRNLTQEALQEVQNQN